jgi:hypothetical protein
MAKIAKITVVKLTKGDGAIKDANKPIATRKLRQIN